MSGESGAIAEVLAGHREDATYPDTCICETEIPDYLDNHYAHHLATALLASPALADLLAAERQRGREEALRVVRQVESDMGEQAYEAWRSADARRGLSDHDALLVHADALTRWSERFRMAFDGDYYAAEGER